MVHSVSRWTRGVQVKLWDPWERMPYLSALEMCSRQDAIQIHVYLYLYRQVGQASKNSLCMSGTGSLVVTFLAFNQLCSIACYMVLLRSKHRVVTYCLVVWFQSSMDANPLISLPQCVSIVTARRRQHTRGPTYRSTTHTASHTMLYGRTPKTRPVQAASRQRHRGPQQSLSTRLWTRRRTISAVRDMTLMHSSTPIYLLCNRHKSPISRYVYCIHCVCAVTTRNYCKYTTGGTDQDFDRVGNAKSAFRAWKNCGNQR